jgi:hypothetical protein
MKHGLGLENIAKVILMIRLFGRVDIPAMQFLIFSGSFFIRVSSVFHPC